jgi:hypothetical protein
MKPTFRGPSRSSSSSGIRDPMMMMMKKNKNNNKKKLPRKLKSYNIQVTEGIKI